MAASRKYSPRVTILLAGHLKTIYLDQDAQSVQEVALASRFKLSRTDGSRVVGKQEAIVGRV
jgi:hypothetical protein